MLADDVAQRGQRHLDHGVVDVGDLDHGEVGLDDAVPDDGVDLHRHVVRGDRLLLLDRRR